MMPGENIARNQIERLRGFAELHKSREDDDGYGGGHNIVTTKFNMHTDYVFRPFSSTDELVGAKKKN